MIGIMQVMYVYGKFPRCNMIALFQYPFSVSSITYSWVKLLNFSLASATTVFHVHVRNSYVKKSYFYLPEKKCCFVRKNDWSSLIKKLDRDSTAPINIAAASRRTTRKCNRNLVDAPGHTFYDRAINRHGTVSLSIL